MAKSKQCTAKSKRCTGCDRSLPRGSFGKKQWKDIMESIRRCKRCQRNPVKEDTAAIVEARACNSTSKCTVVEGVEHRSCSECHTAFPKHGYSNSQWTGKPIVFGWITRSEAIAANLRQRRCKQCLDMKRKRGELSIAYPTAAVVQELNDSNIPAKKQCLEDKLRPAIPPSSNRWLWSVAARQAELAKHFAIEAHWRHKSEDEWRCENPTMPPPHLDDDFRNELIRADAMLEVSSGAICFGLRHQCSRASKEEAVGYPDTARKSAVFNYRAYNGTWLVYKLQQQVTPANSTPEFNSRSGEPWKRAWFVCHSQLCPVKEVRLLLYHGQYGTNEDVQFAYHRLGPCDWKRANGQLVSESESPSDGGYHAIDTKDARDEMWFQGSGEMVTDGAQGDQICIIGFAKQDAAKSFLLFDNDCDFEKLYFKSSKYPIYHMPWGPGFKSWTDEHDPRFFITQTETFPRCAGQPPQILERLKHKYIYDIHGKPFATKFVANLLKPSDGDTGEIGAKAQKSIAKFFLRVGCDE